MQLLFHRERLRDLLGGEIEDLCSNIPHKSFIHFFTSLHFDKHAYVQSQGHTYVVITHNMTTSYTLLMARHLSTRRLCFNTSLNRFIAYLSQVNACIGNCENL